ncbi:MAG: hypothetical protein ABIL09_23740 [Gemmatimonadota bacterium]
MTPPRVPRPATPRSGAALLLAALVALATPAAPAEDCDCGDDGAAAARPGWSPAGLGDLGEDGRLRLDLFVMSLCPYGMEAERALVPLIARLGDRVDFRLHFIADAARPPGDTGADRPASAPAAARPGCAARPATPTSGPFASLHGQDEVDEDRRQVVVAVDHPRALLPYLMCRASRGPNGDWRLCSRAAGLDPEALEAVAQGPRGLELLTDNIGLANERGIHLSPTLLLDGVEYTGRLDPFAVGRGLCRTRPGDPLCAEWPVCGADEDCAGPAGTVSLCLEGDTPAARCEHREPVPFALTVLLPPAGACPRCDSGEFLRTTAELFPGARVVEVDGASDEGARLAAQYGVEELPAYILGQEFGRTARFERVRHLLLERGGAYLVQPRVASTTYWQRRALRPGELDVFLPAGAFGPPAAAPRLLALEDALLRAWPLPAGAGPASPSGGPAVRLRLHYLPASAPDETAPEELLRRACVQALEPDGYRAYAARRNSQLAASPADSTGWREAGAAAGIDPEGLAACAGGPEGRGRLAAVAALADSLGLDRQRLSALLENRVLVRRLQPEELPELWRDRSVP